MLVFDITVSHGSVATRVRCGGMFDNDFIANLPLSLTVKEFWKSVNIWRSHRQKYNGMFFLTHSVDVFRVYVILTLSEINQWSKRAAVISVKVSCLLEECFSCVEVLYVLIKTRFRLFEGVFVITKQHRVSQYVLLVCTEMFVHKTFHNFLQNTFLKSLWL